MLEWIYNGTGTMVKTQTQLCRSACSCPHNSTHKHFDFFSISDLCAVVFVFFPPLLLLVNCVHGVLGFPVEHFVMFCKVFLMNKFDRNPVMECPHEQFCGTCKMHLGTAGKG